MLDLNVLNYLKERNQWLPSLGKAPLRINTSSEKWNEKGNQYSLKECIEYKLNKQREDIIGYIQFQLESNGFQIEKPLIYRGDKNLLLNGKEVNFLEFLEQTDCVELLDYALKNQTFLNKVDVEQITFDKAKKCNEILKDFKLELEKNKDFNINDIHFTNGIGLHEEVTISSF